MLPFYTYLFKHAIPITVGPEWHATHEPIRNVYTFLGDNSSLTFSTNFSLVSKSSPYPTYTSLSEKSSPISSFNFSISVGIKKLDLNKEYLVNYEETDKLLYKVKENGKNSFIIG